MQVNAIDKATDFEYCGDIHASFDQKMAGLEVQINALYELMPFGSYSTAADGTCVSINNQALLWIGCTRESILGKKLPADKIAAANWRTLQRHAEQLQLDGLDEIELNLTDAKNQRRPIGLHAKHLEVPGISPEMHEIDRFVFFDLTEAKRARDLQRIAAMAFESQMGICVADSHGSVLETNKAFCRITGYSSEELRGKSAAPMLSFEENGPLQDVIRSALTSKGIWEGEIRERRKNGEVFIGWLSISSIADKNDGASHFVICLYDITASKASQDEISRLAYFDSLTQLPNRRKLNRRLSEILDKNPDNHLHGALLFIDLDNFKSINDTRGHASGDLLLIEVGRRLRHAVRGSDTVARVGGDEFVVLLSALVADPVEATHQATLVGKEILARLAKPYKLDGFIFNCSASIGISLFSHADLEADVLQQADMAMYQAKRTGRNSLCIFDPAMKEAVSAHSNLEQDLGQAIRRNEMELFFQPQCDFNGHIASAEALLRWRHPTRGLIGPKDFIGIAEESGLILSIGLWVLKEACKQIKIWDADDLMKGIQIAINVSASQFKQQGFVDEVIQAIVESGIDPARIKFELTESMMHSIDETRAKMEKIRELGVRFSLDDFGTGYSSLSSLIQLPLEQLKIDQSFVSNMLSRPGDQIVVKTIIGMAHSLGLEVIAEGLETEAQKDFLHLHGCALYQGYLFSPALSAEAFFTFVQNRDH
ncbi:MAG: hypothetical protein RI928_825 [Pseudomonadota bacterium]|jgi:diguanylate cyclase (GGDEF)-like protein/PAS domain S-box-containing protein